MTPPVMAAPPVSPAPADPITPVPASPQQRLHGQGRPCVITRRATFSASHRYWLPELSAEQNQARFGPCSLAPGHGHNYELIVAMGGGLDADGMVLNLSEVKHAIRAEVTAPLDFRYLNDAWPGVVEIAEIERGGYLRTDGVLHLREVEHHAVGIEAAAHGHDQLIVVAVARGQAAGAEAGLVLFGAELRQPVAVAGTEGGSAGDHTGATLAVEPLLGASGHGGDRVGGRRTHRRRRHHGRCHDSAIGVVAS